MGKPTICLLGENKDADQLRGKRHCFRYSDSTIPLLLKSEISSFYLFSVLVQAGLYLTRSETHCWFSHEVAHIFTIDVNIQLLNRNCFPKTFYKLLI